MAGKIPIILTFLSLLVLLKYGHYVRNVGYDKVPESYNLLDERTNVWHGLSLRDTGVPAAWSDLRTYWNDWPKSITEINTQKQGLYLTRFNILRDKEKLKLFPDRNFSQLTIFTTEYDFGAGKRYTSIVQPYLDHPPFGALVLSSLVSHNVTNTENLTPADFRRTSLWLADLTAILVFLLALQIFKNPLISLASAAFYESVPTYLFTSRLAILENVLIPVQLLSLNILILAIRNKQKRGLSLYRTSLVIAGIFSGLAFLTKTPGIAVIFSGIIILFLQKESRKNLFIFAIPALAVSSLYFIWGFFLAPQVFPKILIEQSTERIFVGSVNFIQQLFKYGMESFPIDGWWIGGFLTMLFLKFNKETLPLIVSIITLLFVIPFAGASGFPWYFVPLIPFAAISTAYFFWNLLKTPTFSKILILFFVFFSSTYFWAFGVFSASPDFKNHQQQFFIYKFFLVFFFGLAILVHFKYEKSNTLRFFWMLGIVILTLLLIRSNFRSIFYMIANWGHLINNFSPNWVL